MQVNGSERVLAHCMASDTSVSVAWPAKGSSSTRTGSSTSFPAAKPARDKRKKLIQIVLYCKLLASLVCVEIRCIRVNSVK